MSKDKTTRLVAIDSILQSSPVGVVIYRADASKEILYSNQNLWNILDCRSEREFMEFTSGSYLRLVAPDEAKTLGNIVAQAMAHQVRKTHVSHYHVLTRTGRKVFVEDRGGILTSDHENDLVICYISTEVQKAGHMSDTSDYLTGFFALPQFIEYADEILKQADQDGTYQNYVMIYSNIHNFKTYNLQFGMEAGDQLIQRVGETIRELFPMDLNARYGSDHFITLTCVPDVIERLEREVDELYNLYYTTGLSHKIGYYRFNHIDSKAEIAVNYARAACQIIRDTQLNVTEYSKEMHRHFYLLEYLSTHLDEAIERHDIRVYYQPVIGTLSDRICSMEALARWIDPNLGPLSPGEFIPILEELHLITKLDLFILREICRMLHQREQAGEKLIPVSFNLSRLDLQDDKIFEKVDAVLTEYAVARDMIFVEITESSIMEDVERATACIDRFRSGGYQVWMDDFGSGYSSLNILKDIQFDEIKLDMKFLSTLDNRSKNIIRSMIQMAKQIGVQTLAEGVETEDQYQFLKQIGCERVQGYLISKPQPFDGIRQALREGKWDIEKRADREYYRRLGKINFMTDRAMALVQYDWNSFTFTLCNRAFSKELERIGITDIETVEANINAKEAYAYRLFQDVQTVLHQNDPAKEVSLFLLDRFVRISVLCVGENQEHKAFYVEISSADQHEETDEIIRQKKLIQMVLGLYDSIHLWNMRTGSFETLISDPKLRETDIRSFKEKQKTEGMLAAGRIFIHHLDQKAYEEFSDEKTLAERLEASPRHILVGVFRTSNGKGEYLWKSHTLLYLNHIHSVIYVIRSITHGEIDALQKTIAPVELALPVGEKQAEYRMIYHTIMQSQVLNVFWKDKERRFLNVNDHFLKTYGLTDASELIGKTDEDLGWHTDKDKLRDDELSVIHEGNVVRSSITRNFIQGTARYIIASKEPLYRNGEIAGLMGTFVDVDDVLNRTERAQTIPYTDEVTGLMNATGLSGMILQYIEDWHIRKENFAVLRISVREYKRSVINYGEAIAREQLIAGARMIQTFFRLNAVARLYGGNFAVLIKSQEKETVRETITSFQEKAGNVYSLAGYPATLHPIVDCRFADEAEDMQSLITMATGGVQLIEEERQRMQEAVNRYRLQLDSLLKALPGGTVLYELDETFDPQIIQMSQGSVHKIGYTEQEFYNQARQDHYFAVCTQDREEVRNAVNYAVATETDVNINFRLCAKNGDQIWINLQGRAVGRNDGKLLLLCVFRKIGDVTRDFEAMLDNALVGILIRGKTDKDIYYANLTAKKIAKTYFKDSLDGMCTEIVKEKEISGMWPSIEAVTKQGEQYEVICQNRHFFVRTTSCLWNGRESVVFYIMDITTRLEREMREGRRTKETYLDDEREKGGNIPEDREANQSDQSDQGGYPQLTSDELKALMQGLSKIYDIVRVVDAQKMRIMNFSDDGICKLSNRPCYEVWGTEERCKNCSSALAFRKKNRLAKFEFLGDEIYHVTSQYILVDGSPAILEIVEKNDDEMLFGAIGKNKIVNSVKEYARRIYIDSVTGVRNRMYMDEQLIALEMDAAVIIDVDDFKKVNDTYGHIVGDRVLRAVAQKILENVRMEDAVIRYGGDEFVIAFPFMKAAGFKDRLETIRKAVEGISIPEMMNQHVTVSIGGIRARKRLEHLLPEADKNLYEAKKKKNGVVTT